MSTPIKYMKNPALFDQEVRLPIFGKIEPDAIYVGVHAAQFSPQFLVEVPSTPARTPLEANEPPKNEELVEPSPAITETPLESTDSPKKDVLESRTNLSSTSDKVVSKPRLRGRPKKPALFSATNPLTGHWETSQAEIAETSSEHFTPNRSAQIAGTGALTEASSARGLKGKVEGN